ncbi:MAG: GTP cyclohydrolase II RibA [Candidatus Obscuribacterales bacterium]
MDEDGQISQLTENEGFLQPTSRQTYVDGQISTKAGVFQIRVYEGAFNAETVVLWKDGIDREKPVTLRIHSECITGDVFGSRHCDCGDQLHRSLQIIQRECGVLVYLRQEGRGIGLFDKIRAYNLQRQGFDTREANILLGHQPDERTYEAAAHALQDLDLTRVRLLTNNPFKASEIAKLGITVSECIPISPKSNSDSAYYIKTKIDKFLHIIEKSGLYHYQFHVDTPEQLERIGRRVDQTSRDPFLRIAVGVSACDETFGTPSGIANIQSIFELCEEFPLFQPVLHFSFCSSPYPVQSVDEIRRSMPFVRRLHLNDVPSHLIKRVFSKAAPYFHVTLPLCDLTESVLDDFRFASKIRKHGASVVLDNSKGKGITEHFDTLRGKIEWLLERGIRNIGVAGGFGPDRLSTYFGLRRFFRINLSIDSETHLKSDGEFDVDKTLRYLFQLMRFDDPKSKAIQQTLDFMKGIRLDKAIDSSFEGHVFQVYPGVFNCGAFPSTTWFAAQVKRVIGDSLSFCEVGCGAGVVSCLVALDNPKRSVTATDICPNAVRNAKENTERFNLTDRVQVIESDVLDAVPKEKKFDYIFWAMPFGFLDPGSPVSAEGRQVFDPGYRAITKFIATAKDYLKPNGRLLMGFSPDLGHPSLLNALAEEHRLHLNLEVRALLQEKDTVRFELLSGHYY